MGLILGLIKFLIKLLLYFAIFVAIIILIPNLPPYTKFTSIQLEPTQERIGSLAPNDLLNNAKKLYEGKLIGPEAFQIYNGELYSSLATGEIVKVSQGGHITFVTKIGQPCTGPTQEHKCGRPLGFQIDEKTNTLYVADAYHGIWKVDLKTDKKQLLVSPQVPIEGRNPKLFNSIALAKNGDFYWTDSTSDFQLKDGAISMLTDPSGRLFHYNAVKNQSKVLLDNLWFPNGITLSDDNQFLVYAETCRFRLMKYYIDGPKKGKSEVFAAGLPGVPDNVRALPDKSGVLVGLYTVFDEDNPLITRTMAATPIIRKFLARLQRLIEIPFEHLNSIYPHFVFEEIVYNIGHFNSVSGFAPSLSGLLQLDWNGNIVASYFNTDQSLNHISDAIVYNGNLHTGNPHIQDFIGSVPAPPLLLKAFSTKKVEQQIPKVVQKPEQVKVQETKSKIQEKPRPEENVVPKIVKPVETKPSQPTPQQMKPVNEKKQTLPENVKIETQPTPTEPVKTTTKPEIKVAPKLETKPSPKPETKPSPKPESKPTPKPETKPTTRSETKPTPKPETKPTTKPETKPTPKPESKPTPKPETKPTPKPESKPTPTPETKPTTKPEIKQTPKSETKPETNPPSKPTPTPETKPTTKPEIKQNPKLETKATPKPETKPTAKPEVRENPKQDTKPPSPKPISQQETKPEIKNDPNHKTKTTLEPEVKTSKPTVVKQTKNNNEINQNREKPIPIKEDIQSDTKQPNAETLKVIKKGGPTEIPNPQR